MKLQHKIHVYFFVHASDKKQTICYIVGPIK